MIAPEPRPRAEESIFVNSHTFPRVLARGWPGSLWTHVYFGSLLNRDGHVLQAEMCGGEKSFKVYHRVGECACMASGIV